MRDTDGVLRGPQPTSWTRPLQLATAAYLVVAAIPGLVNAFLLDAADPSRLQAYALRWGLTPDQAHQVAVQVTGSLARNAVISLAVGVTLAVGSVRRWRWAYWVTAVFLLTAPVGLVFDLRVLVDRNLELPVPTISIAIAAVAYWLAVALAIVFAIGLIRFGWTAWARARSLDPSPWPGAVAASLLALTAGATALVPLPHPGPPVVLDTPEPTACTTTHDQPLAEPRPGSAPPADLTHQRWRYQAVGDVQAFAAGPYLVVKSPTGVAVLDPSTGRERWHCGRPWDLQLDRALAARDGRGLVLFFKRQYGTDGLVMGLDLASGRELWRRTEASGTDWHAGVAAASTDRTVVYLRRWEPGIQLTALDLRTGAVRWNQELTTGCAGSLGSGGRGAVPLLVLRHALTGFDTDPQLCAGREPDQLFFVSDTDGTTRVWPVPSGTSVGEVGDVPGGFLAALRQGDQESLLRFDDQGVPSGAPVPLLVACRQFILDDSGAPVACHDSDHQELTGWDGATGSSTWRHAVSDALPDIVEDRGNLYVMTHPAFGDATISILRERDGTQVASSVLPRYVLSMVVTPTAIVEYGSESPGPDHTGPDHTVLIGWRR